MRSIMRLALCTLVLLAAGSLRAAVSETTGPVNFSGNQLAEWNVDVDFGATPTSLNIDLTCGFTEQASGFRIEMYDITRAARATTTTAWNDGMPIWDTGAPFTPGTYNLAIGGSPYQTLSLSGVHRFIIAISPSDGASTTNNDVTLTFDIAGTATSMGSGFHIWTTRPAGGGLGSIGTASGFYQRNYNGNALLFTNIGAASDTVQYEFDVDFGATPVQKAISIWAFGFTSSTGTGNVDFEVYSLGEGFEDPAKIIISCSPGVESEGTYTTAALSGPQKFRVVASAGTGFSATIETIAFFTVESGPTLADAIVNPTTASTPMAITPAGTTLTTSPTALTASGGTPTVTYNWTLQGTVPTGVSLSAATGTTVNLVFGSSTPASSTVTVRCTNGVGPEFTEETYTLNFGGGGGGNSLTIVTTTLPNGSETVVYPTTNITATSTGTTGPNYTWSVSAGTLPPGLTLDTAATGLTTTISGTPTTAGTYNFTVQITDGTNSDTQSFQVDISAAGALVITTSSLAAGTQGAAYSANITAINGVGNHTWSISAGTLPTGLSLGASTTATVSISGTPTQTGTFPITVQVTDSTVPTAQTDTQAFSLVINASSPPPSLGGGGGGGGGGGCAATGGNSYWMFAIGLLAMLGFALRMRARRE